MMGERHGDRSALFYEFSLERHVSTYTCSTSRRQRKKVAIRNAISIGGDSGTVAAITGSMAHAKWGAGWFKRRLDDRFFDAMERFGSRATR